MMATAEIKAGIMEPQLNYRARNEFQSKQYVIEVCEEQSNVYLFNEQQLEQFVNKPYFVH